MCDPDTAAHDSVVTRPLADSSSDTTSLDTSSDTTSLDSTPSDATPDTMPVRDAVVPTDTTPVRDTTREVVAAERRHRVRFTAPAGPVHVSGFGSRGLAPVTSEVLPDGQAIAFHLAGGASPLDATLRVRMKDGQLSASIGAPADTHYTVTWGGAEHVTPVFGLAVPPGGVTCRLVASDGRAMTFVVADVVE